MRFCFKLWENATETSKMLNVAVGEQTVGRTQVFEWFASSKSVWPSIEDAECSGHPSTAKTV
jgi:hypothetical protein